MKGACNGAPAWSWPRWSGSAGPTAGPEAYNDRLRIDGKKETVRSFDCLHLVARGAEVLAYEVIFATQGAWAAAPVPTG